MYSGMNPPSLQADSLTFPDIATAQRERNGLVAMGGELTSDRLLTAYRQGIFPWYDEHHPILWWAFTERMVLKTDAVHCSRSLHKSLRKHRYCITVNYAFSRVIRRCAHTYRPGQNSTWLTQEMQQAFIVLHQQGTAHSFEYWCPNGTNRWYLAGGFYGILIGQIFFGESMFFHRTDASKITFVHAARFLQQHSVVLIDCRIHTDHMARFGALKIPFDEFRHLLDLHCPQPISTPISASIIHRNTDSSA